MEDKPTALGAFIFAGGFTLGMRDHFDVVAHLEGDAYGVETMRRNQPNVPVFIGAKNWPLRQFKNEVDTVYGNPPCAAWSMAGRRGEHWRDDERVDCTRLHFSLLRNLQPRRAWVWESVTQAFTKGREFVNELTRKANRAGYHVTYILHDGQWLGLPQVRRRFFFVAHRGDAPEPPRLNWAPPDSAREVLREIRGQAGRPAQTAENKYLYLLEHAEPGEQLYKVFDRLNPGVKIKGVATPGRPGYLARRIPREGPALTFAGGSWFHPTQRRQLALEEYKALCGYPVDYEFTPTGDQAKLSELARGVTPPVGSWLGRWLRSSVGTHDPGRPGVFMIDVRKPPGSFEVLR